jgi:hypothetical protein
MESIHNIFTATIAENKENEQLSNIISELAFELSKKKIQRLKDQKNIQSRLSELFELYVKALESEGVKNPTSVGCVIDGIVKAASYDKEEFLYKSIYEKDQLERSINEQKRVIRSTILDTFSTIEAHIENMEEETATQAYKALSDAKLKGVEMLGILKETVSEALLTTLEQGKDVEDTVFEITKNITYQAINGGEFTKNRFLDISSSVIEVAIEIADEDQGYAKELLGGAVHGTKEGMAKAIDKFKNDLKFAPEEIEDIIEKDLGSVRRELVRIEEAFIKMLEDTSKISNGIAAKVIKEILSSEFNTSLAKMKRVANEAREAISEKIDELKENASNMEYDFVEKAEQKIASLKEEMNKLEKKAGTKFESLKKELNELEKTASQKLDSIKNFEFENEKAQRAASEAKRLGNRAWEVAKGMVDGALKGAKEAMRKDK